MTDSPLDVLAAPRSNLDRINAQILDLLVERMRTCLEIARSKAEHNIPMMQPHRVQAVLGLARGRAREEGLAEDYLVGVFRQVIEATCAAEDELIARLGGARP